MKITQGGGKIKKVNGLSEKKPEYEWTVNGVKQEINLPILTPEHFSRGDTVFCSALISDDEKARIGSILIGNKVPSIQSLWIIPEDQRRGIDIRVEASVFDLENRLIWKVPEIEKDTTFYIEIVAKDERGGETIISFSLNLFREIIENKQF